MTDNKALTETLSQVNRKRELEVAELQGQLGKVRAGQSNELKAAAASAPLPASLSGRLTTPLACVTPSRPPQATLPRARYPRQSHFWRS